MNVDITTEKETVIHTYLKRTKHGVKVDVIVVPEVEEFFKHWGTEQKVNVALNGRSWKAWPPSKEGEKSAPLLVWGINTQSLNDTIGQFDIFNTGRSLAAQSERGQNISFIRLVGASEGVSFLYEDIVSWDGLNLMADRIKLATQRFYDQYIRPSHLHITLTSDVQRLE